MIRLLNRHELEDALPLVWNVFCEYEAVNYPESGKLAFRDAINSREYLDTLCAFGAFENDKLIGIIATRNEGSHIALFFVRGDYQGKGIGRSLWNAVLESSDAGEITVHSSIYAQDIYKKLGFVPSGELREEAGIQYIPMIFRR